MSPAVRRFASVAGGLTGLVAAGLYFGLGLHPAWALLAALNVATFALYAYDKAAAAAAGRGRVPEFVLHVAALAGGSPGAFAAQRVLRHKTVKRSFQAAFWTIVAVQVVGVVSYFAMGGRGA
ncbi:MAG: DUF1294 domain-containing protein [Phycisphaerae bacterium]